MLNSWQISYNLDETDELRLNEICVNACNLNLTNTYLLNTDKIDSIIEKVIYDTAVFHFKRLNIPFDETSFIEFWFKPYQKDKVLHIDCDEYDRKINKSKDFNTPFLSSILYLNDNYNSPTLITNVDVETYKFKRFTDKQKVAFYFPQKNKHIAFDGGKYYHGKCDFSNDNSQRNIIAINLWNKKPLNVPYFDYSAFSFKYSMDLDMELKQINFNSDLNVLQFESDDKTNTIPVSGDVLSKSLFDQLLYKGYDHTTIEPFNKEITNMESDGIFVFEIKESSKTLIDMQLSKFVQRFTHKTHFTKDMCNWIIHESEKYAENNGGWMKTRHILYPTTDLPIDKITPVFHFVLLSFRNTISGLIANAYNLDSNYTFEIADLFIVKYEAGQQDSLELHTDTSCISVNLLLNDPAEFVGGGTQFEDGLTAFLSQGDMMIHSSGQKHSGLQITSGKRYVLVFFINIYNS